MLSADGRSGERLGRACAATVTRKRRHTLPAAPRRPKRRLRRHLCSPPSRLLLRSVSRSSTPLPRRRLTPRRLAIRSPPSPSSLFSRRLCSSIATSCPTWGTMYSWITPPTPAASCSGNSMRPPASRQRRRSSRRPSPAPPGARPSAASFTSASTCGSTTLPRPARTRSSAVRTSGGASACRRSARASVREQRLRTFRRPRRRCQGALPRSRRHSLRHQPTGAYAVLRLQRALAKLLRRHCATGRGGNRRGRAQNSTRGCVSSRRTSRRGASRRRGRRRAGSRRSSRLARLAGRALAYLGDDLLASLDAAGRSPLFFLLARNASEANWRKSLRATLRTPRPRASWRRAPQSRRPPRGPQRRPATHRDA